MFEEWVIPGIEKKEGGTRDLAVVLAIGAINLRQTIKNHFRTMGTYQVYEAGSGDKVIRILKDEIQHKDYFVILDMDMPGTPGLSVIREIRAVKKLENLALLLVADNFDANDIALLAELEVSGCMVKPFGLGTLEDKFNEIMRGRSNPPEHVKMIYVGEKLLSEQNHSAALQVFQESQKLKNSARVNVHIGEAFERLTKYDLAHRHYDDAININNKYIRAYSFAANLHLRLSKENLALPYLEGAAKISPYNAYRQHTLGRIYLNYGDETAAYSAFEMAVKVDPKFSLEIAEKFLEYGDALRAEYFFRKSLNVEKKKVEVLNRLGIALRRQGKWQDAVIAYKNAIRLDKRDGGLFFNLGRSYLEGGKAFEAKNCFNTALRLDPNLHEAREEIQKLSNPS